MSSSSLRTIAANQAVAPGLALEGLLRHDNLGALLAATHVDWSAGRLLAAPPEILRVLREIAGITDDSILTRTGVRVLGKLQFDITAAMRSAAVTARFVIKDRLAEGSQSVAFLAMNRAVERSVVLKVLRPAPAVQIAAAIHGLSGLDNIPHLVLPFDAIAFDAESVSGDRIPLHALIFPFVRGTTLDDFLRSRPQITPYFFEAFIRQVGGVLAELEERGKSHGDLHGGNILVSSEDPRLEFTVIDPSPGIDIATPYGVAGSDYEWLQGHLARALEILQRHLPSISVKKHLGARLYSALSRILESDNLSVQEAIRLLDVNSQYDDWLRQRRSFIAEKFEEPKPLGLLRWEEIADPAQAVALFEPYPELFRRVRAFGNSLIEGARGSGKSTYLAALAYFPGATKRLVPPEDIFGILFSCRQGEFKQLNSSFVAFDALGRARVKHVLVIKIIRRLLDTLAAAVDRGELKSSRDFAALYDFIQRHIAELGAVSRPGVAGATALINLAAAAVRWEEFSIRALFVPPSEVPVDASQQMDERSLLAFCELIRSEFSALAQTTFYFLFDDAGDPNITRDAQYVLNDFIKSSNSVYCLKLSAERFSYHHRVGSGGTLEETHDFTSFDITTVYSPEQAIDAHRIVIKQYFAEIMRRRLEYWHYPTGDITSYLGDPSREDDVRIVPVRELIPRLARGQKNAYYAGWEVVWQLADRTPRSLIELVSEIFANSGLKPPQASLAAEMPTPTVIAPRTQDKAIRAVSKRRLRGLEFIPGELRLRQGKVGLGRHLFLCTTSFGKVSRSYLAKPSGTGRIDEMLGIERNDTTELASPAREVLEALVRYGIFDDSTLNVAFDDGQKKPVYVFNRIFCPAFGMSFRRDAHLRLSAGKFEMYLLTPDRFVKSGTHYLTRLDSGAERGLFREYDNED